jgi:hypothetical protein
MVNLAKVHARGYQMLDEAFVHRTLFICHQFQPEPWAPDTIPIMPGQAEHGY